MKSNLGTKRSSTPDITPSIREKSAQRPVPSSLSRPQKNNQGNDNVAPSINNSIRSNQQNITSTASIDKNKNKNINKNNKNKKENSITSSSSTPTKLSSNQSSTNNNLQSSIKSFFSPSTFDVNSVTLVPSSTVASSDIAPDLKCATASIKRTPATIDRSTMKYEVKSVTPVPSSTVVSSDIAPDPKCAPASIKRTSPNTKGEVQDDTRDFEDHKEDFIEEASYQSSSPGKQQSFITTKIGALDVSYQFKGQVLGEGSFGVVVLGVDKEKQSDVAIKVVKKERLKPADLKGLKQEIYILQKLDHHKHRVIGLHRVFDEPCYCYLITELMEGGDLCDRIEKKGYYSEKDAKIICKTLFETIGYCHSEKIAHRDLKPENVLLKSPYNDVGIKIADFGFAKFAKDDYSLRTRLGTQGFIAPEILITCQGYGTKVDMWSLGIIIFMILFGRNPFANCVSIDAIKNMTKSGVFTYDEDEWKYISNEAKDLVKNLLNMKPNERYSAKDALKSSWFEGNDKDETEFSFFCDATIFEDCSITHVSEQVNIENAKSSLKNITNDVIATPRCCADSFNVSSVTTENSEPSAPAA